MMNPEDENLKWMQHDSLCRKPSVKLEVPKSCERDAAPEGGNSRMKKWRRRKEKIGLKAVSIYVLEGGRGE